MDKKTAIDNLTAEIRAAESRVLQAPIETRATEQAYLDKLCAELGKLEDERFDEDAKEVGVLAL